MKENTMTDLTHYRRLILSFAYLHIHPGGGFAGMIMLKPGFEDKLDHIAQANLCELLRFANAHVPHDTRNAQGFNDWLGEEPNMFEQESFDKWMSAITPMPRPTGWEEVDTSA
jgi:hypothetical protein